MATAAAEAVHAKKLQFVKERRDKTRRLATINRLAVPPAANQAPVVACVPDVAAQAAKPTVKDTTTPPGPSNAAAATTTRLSSYVAIAVAPPLAAAQAIAHVP